MMIKITLLTGPIVLFTLLIFTIIETSVSAATVSENEQATLLASNSKFLDLSLEELMNIDVSTSSKRSEGLYDSPGITSVISTKEIELFGANDLTELLSRVASVLPIYETFTNNNTVLVRGDTPRGFDTHMLVLMDGNPINRDSYIGAYNQAIYSSFPISAIQQIEIVKGPGSVLYGTNAYSGVINIITKKDQGVHLSVAPKYGTFNTKAVEAYSNFQSDETGLRVSSALKYLDTDGWLLSANSVTGHNVSGNAYQHGNVGFTTTAAYKNLELSTFYGHTNQYDWRLPTDGAAGWISNTKFFLDLGYKLDLAQNWNLETHISNVGGYTDLLLKSSVNQPLGYPTAINQYRTNDSRWETTVRGKLIDNLNLVSGVVINRMSGEIDNLNLAWVQYWYAVYSQLDYQLTPGLKLIAGAQFNQTPYTGSFVPRLGAVAHFTPEFGLKALYGQAFNAPTPPQTDASIPLGGGVNVVGNPSLSPEFIDTADLQFFYNHPSFQSSLGFFYSHQSSLIVQEPQIGSATNRSYYNSQQLNLMGMELESKYLPTSNIYFLGSLTYQESNDGNGNTGVSFTPSWIAKAGVGYELKSVSLGVFDSYITAYGSNAIAFPANLVTNPASTAYNLLTANVTLNLKQLLSLSSSTPDMKLALYGTNLLDAAYYVPTYYTPGVNTMPGGPGRAVYSSLEMRL